MAIAVMRSQPGARFVTWFSSLEMAGLLAESRLAALRDNGRSLGLHAMSHKSFFGSDD
jgi:hypothetical protein